MDAHVGARIARAAHRHELRAEALDNALVGVEGKAGRVGGEGEALDEGGARERAAAHIAQRAGGDAQFIDGVGEKSAAEPQFHAVVFEREIIDGGRDAENIAQTRRLDHARLCRKAQRDRALHAFRRAAVVAGAGRAVGLAAHDAVERLIVEAAPAGQACDGEGHRAAQAQLEGGIIEAGLVREAQPRDQHAAVGHGASELHEVGLLVLRLGALQRADDEILPAQRLPPGGADAGRGAQFERQQAVERGQIDGLVEGHGEMVEIGDRVRAVGGRCGGGRGEQRHEPRVKPLAGEGDAAQRLPRIGGAELQRARAEPLPRAGRGRAEPHEFLRIVLRAAFRRTGVVVEEQRHRVPGA